MNLWQYTWLVQGSSESATIKTLEQDNEGEIRVGLNEDTNQICNKMDVEPLGSSSALAKQFPFPFHAVCRCTFHSPCYFQSLSFLKQLMQFFKCCCDLAANNAVSLVCSFNDLTSSRPKVYNIKWFGRILKC